jgi:two-component system, response regulator YesN
MYRLLIVDDEPWTLIGISKSFKWRERGFEVVGKMTNPVEASEFIINEKPDVVFTDIRMPVMSGLDLMKNARLNNVDTEFIIISGFGEFYYAQEALRLGAFDYLLKPADLEECDKLLKRLKLRLDSKIENSNDSLIDAIMNNNMDYTKVFNYNRSKYKYYQAIIISSKRDPAIKCEMLPHNINKYEIRIGINKHLLLINAEYDMAEYLENNFLHLKEINNLVDKIGVGGQICNCENLFLSIKEADIALCNSFIYGRNKLYKYKKDNINRLRNAIEKLILLVSLKKSDEFQKGIKEIKMVFQEDKLGIEGVVYFWNQIVMFIKSSDKYKTYFNREDFKGYEQIVNSYRDFDEFCLYIEELLYLITKTSEGTEDSLFINKDFLKLVQFVDDNFCEDIQLKDLSSKFFINYCYCSELFKKVKGRSYNKYITELRMNRASELLKTSDLSTAIVSESVGFKDYFYFNKSFKKHFFVTPLEYRKSNFVYKKVALGEVL